MSRLPIPGSDNGTWGDILNDYLQVSHNTDGTIKPTAVAAAGALQNEAAGFFWSGTVSASAGTFRLYNDSGVTRVITKIRLTAATAPTGSSLVVDINKGGTSLFSSTAHQPTLAAAATTVTVVPDTTTWEDGTYLTADVDSVGSTVAGADIVVNIVYT